jgi:hypothetical protein
MAETPKSPHQAASAHHDVHATASMFIWKFWGGLTLAALAVVALIFYQQTMAQIASLRNDVATLDKDLRKELARLSETQTLMIKKDDHNGRVRQVWDTIKELRSDHSDLTTMKERCSVLVDLFKAGEQDRLALLSEVRKLREKLASDCERHPLNVEIRTLRERLGRLEGSNVGLLPAPTPVVPATHDEKPPNP